MWSLAKMNLQHRWNNISWIELSWCVTLLQVPARNIPRVHYWNRKSFVKRAAWRNPRRPLIFAGSNMPTLSKYDAWTRRWGRPFYTYCSFPGLHMNARCAERMTILGITFREKVSPWHSKSQNDLTSSKAEWTFLKNLSNHKGIVPKAADKGGATIFLRAERPFRQLFRHLFINPMPK